MVNTREIAQEYRLGHWAKIMQEREQSGLSIKAFCQQIGIATNTYFYWQRKLRETACRELAVDSTDTTGGNAGTVGLGDVQDNGDGPGKGAHH